MWPLPKRADFTVCFYVLIDLNASSSAFPNLPTSYDLGPINYVLFKSTFILIVKVAKIPGCFFFNFSLFKTVFAVFDFLNLQTFVSVFIGAIRRTKCSLSEIFLSLSLLEGGSQCSLDEAAQKVVQGWKCLSSLIFSKCIPPPFSPWAHRPPFPSAAEGFFQTCPVKSYLSCSRARCAFF